ncbi:MAG TPA: ABC transporter permease [Gemmatimonadaceae bacterium]|nr:ABC transporter permease [Gemmatimonadaceae bacterium]
MNRLASALRFGFRMLRKTPSAVAMVLVALSLGIGLSAVMFSLIQGAVLARLPVERGDQIVRIQRSDPSTARADDYATWVSRQRSFAALGAYDLSTVTLSVEGTGGDPVRAAAITPSILPLVAVRPQLGRPFTEADAIAGAPAVILVGHDLWRDRLGSDPSVLGRVVRVNGRPAQIVGVMPRGFGFPLDEQVWSPLDTDPTHAAGAAFIPTGEARGVVGRLRDGTSAPAAAKELTFITTELDREKRGDSGLQSDVKVRGYTDLFSKPGQSATLAALMLGVAFLVLLVACSNVANVLLARAVARRREIAVRLAIGASRARITTQLLIETSLLAAMGAVGGVAVAIVATRNIGAAMPAGMPYWIQVGIDWPVLGFVVVVAGVAALMAGLVPALQAARSNTHDVLKDDARGSSSFHVGRMMRKLIGVEIALSFVLLVLAGLFIRSATNFQATDFAFRPTGVYSALVRLPDAATSDPAAQARRSERLRETLTALPQAAGAALTTAVPGVGSSQVAAVEIDGRRDAAGTSRARSITVSPGFFELFRTRLLAGRDFDTRDRPDAVPVAIVNESFARRYMPDGALDHRVRLSGRDGKGEWLTIVGVTQDLMEGGVEGWDPEAVYLPFSQHAQTAFTIVVRPRASFESLPVAVRESLLALEPDMALFDVQRLEAVIYDANSGYTWLSILFLVSGGVALFLAALGLYGVMAFWVIQRTREIGVRMALGSQRRDIVRLVLRQGFAQTSVGLVAGLLLAVAAAVPLRSAMFGVTPYDPVVFASVLGVMLAAAWLGCWMPARRATRVDPLRAMMSE